MFIVKILLLSAFAVAASPAAKEGVITGTVVNASRGRTLVADSEVVLRIRLSGQFVPFDQTKTDAQGRFRFAQVPVGQSYVYRPGANRDGVHYPGPALELMPQQPSASVELAVCDSVAESSPLVIRRQEVVLRNEPGSVRVTESILVDNPTNICYVGRPTKEGSEPITLALAIPPEFNRTTFQEEFYGRRFTIAGGKLVTGIPWPPGQRELKFTYVVPTKSPSYRWQRPLDLPCDTLRVRVENAKPGEVVCNLKRGSDEKAGTAAFESEKDPLSAGYVVQVDLGPLPLPLMAYARWLALALLGILVAGTSVILIRRRRQVKGAIIAGTTPHQSQSSITPLSPASREQPRGKRKKSRRAA